MKKTGKADYIINEAGCGSFQILIVVFANVLPKTAAIYSVLFMAFGNYNPGWKCSDLDLGSNVTRFSNDSLTSYSSNVTVSPREVLDTFFVDSANSNETSEYHVEDSCDLFKSCKNIEFYLDTSTIVTEWGLICDHAWVPSLMISMQMVGVLVGSLVAGQLGDTFGRKKVLFIPLATCGIINLVAVFSTYWQIYCAMRFFLGVMIACIFNCYNLYPAEFLNSKWRVRASAIPSWPLGGFLLAISATVFKDWRSIHIAAGILLLISCIPGLWTPESLRWLEVKDKPEEFQKVAKKMLEINKIELPLESCDCLELKTSDESSQDRKARTYTVADLFRKGYRMYTLIVGFVWFSCMVVFYGINYGVKAMYGDFYINLFIIFAADVPYSLLPMYLPNKIGRKRANLLFNTLTAASLLVTAGFVLWAPASVRNTGSLVFALIAKMNVVASLSSSFVLTTELFPTVVRSNAVGFINFMSRIGGIIAPAVIPKNSRDLYVCHVAMGAMCLVCCISILKLPETKGKKIKEVFDEC